MASPVLGCPQLPQVRMPLMGGELSKTCDRIAASK